MIYLDNAATTRVPERVIEVMNRAYREDFYNPSALYAAGTEVKKQVETARAEIAERLGVGANEIVFTSCATESNTWALQCGLKNKKGNLVVTDGEHSSIYQNAMLLKSKRVDVRFAPLDSDGRVDTKRLLALIDGQTSLVSVIHCSNETGAVNDIKEIAAAVKRINPNCLVHSDGVQALCKISNDCLNLGVDMYSVSAHKIGGAKGIGAIYIRKPLKLSPLIVGGGQENGNRSGTENVAGILGFAEAVRCYKSYDIAAIRSLRAQVCKILLEGGAVINGGDSLSGENSGAIISASFEGIRAEILQHILAEQGIYIGLGSACSSHDRNNRVLSAMGLPPKLIEGSIRLSFGADTVEKDVIFAAGVIADKVMGIKLHG